MWGVWLFDFFRTPFSSAEPTLKPNRMPSATLPKRPNKFSPSFPARLPRNNINQVPFAKSPINRNQKFGQPQLNNKYPDQKKSIFVFKDFVNRMKAAKVGMKSMEIAMEYYELGYGVLSQDLI